MKNILEKFRNFPEKLEAFRASKFFLPTALGLFSILLAVQTTLSQKDRKAPVTAPIAESPDTYIPRGFVLIPIDVQNIESLDSMIGQFGIVDLYGESERRPIETGVRIIRSPRNPDQFAVLIPEQDAPRVVERAFNPLRVVLQNSKGSTGSSEKPKRKRNIIFEGSTTLKSTSLSQKKETA